MQLSIPHVIIVCVCIAAATFLAAVGEIDATPVAMGLVALAGNALGYFNGRRNAHAAETPAERVPRE